MRFFSDGRIAEQAGARCGAGGRRHLKRNERTKRKRNHKSEAKRSDVGSVRCRCSRRRWENYAPSGAPRSGKRRRQGLLQRPTVAHALPSPSHPLLPGPYDVKNFHCALQRHTPQRKVHAHGPLQRSKFRSQHGNSRDLKILNKYPKTRKNCAEIDPALYVLTFSAKKAPNIGLDRPSSLCFDGIFCTCSSLCTYQGLARFRFRSRSRACVSTHELDLSLKETPKRTPKRDTSTGPLAKFWSGAKVRNAGRS